MKLQITIHPAYCGYVWRVDYNYRKLVRGLLVKGWTLEQVINLSFNFIKQGIYFE